MQKKIFYCVFVVICILKIPMGYADITFKGRLVSLPPCSISNDALIDVDFGDSIGVNTVDGANYKKKINYSVTCTQSAPVGSSLILMLKGNPANYDSEKASINTNKNGLGIKFYLGGQAFKLDTKVKINVNSLPTLEAVPIKNPSVDLTQGFFESTGTLLAEYQ